MATVIDMFNTESYKSLKVALSANRLRQKLIASNVANIDTPGYKTRDVSFKTLFDQSEDNLTMKMSLTHPRHMEGLSHDARMEEALFYAYHPKDPHDGINDVDTDREMVKNNETAMNFQIYSKLIKGKYDGIRNLIDSSF